MATEPMRQGCPIATDRSRSRPKVCDLSPLLVPTAPDEGSQEGPTSPQERPLAARASGRPRSCGPSAGLCGLRGSFPKTAFWRCLSEERGTQTQSGLPPATITLATGRRLRGGGSRVGSRRAARARRRRVPHTRNREPHFRPGESGVVADPTQPTTPPAPSRTPRPPRLARWFRRPQAIEAPSRPRAR